MQTFLQLVKSRRSIRKYDKRLINREDLESCVEAARYAPSACNSQPWKFIIIDDPLKKKLVTQNVFSGSYKMNTFARTASAFIAIISEKTKLPAWIGGKLRNTDFKRIDIGIASEHIVLQAEDLGIGTCILGWFNERKLKKILSVPRAKKIDLIIALGYPTQQELPKKALKDKSGTVSFNKY
ncbi:nitroreductase family protein [Candidatus Omnitrophota bacterium]